MQEKSSNWEHDTASFDSIREWPDESVNGRGPVTNKVSELAPESIVPIIVPTVDIAESGLHKTIKKIRDAAAVTGDIVWSTIKVGLWGDH